MDTHTRFMSKVVKSDECWLWTGGVSHSGYGTFRADKMVRAHKWLWEQEHGRPVRDGYELDHICRTRLCVRPDHLEEVTHDENMLRTRATHCRRGHPLSGDNLYVNNGGRYCRACNIIRGQIFRRRRGQKPARVGTDTHCVNGHPWTDANTYRTKRGHRRCRACANERMQEMYRRDPDKFRARARNYHRRSKVA